MDSPANPTGASVPLASRRILCAEDHAQMAELIQKVLTRAGHHVVCVGDGEQALDHAGREHFDIVITDHHMPDASGLDLVTRLRQNGFGGQILLHTSRITAMEQAAYRSLAVETILWKPAGILRLPAMIK